MSVRSRLNRECLRCGSKEMHTAPELHRGVTAGRRQDVEPVLGFLPLMVSGRCTEIMLKREITDPCIPDCMMRL